MNRLQYLESKLGTMLYTLERMFEENKLMAAKHEEEHGRPSPVIKGAEIALKSLLEGFKEGGIFDQKHGLTETPV